MTRLLCVCCWSKVPSGQYSEKCKFYPLLGGFWFPKLCVFSVYFFHAVVSCIQQSPTPFVVDKTSVPSPPIVKIHPVACRFIALEYPRWLSHVEVHHIKLCSCFANGCSALVSKLAKTKNCCCGSSYVVKLTGFTLVFFLG